MREVFSNNGIELKIIPREQKGNQIVSASTVRKALSEDDWETIYRMVPKSTLTYLKSPDGQEIIRKIKMLDAFNAMDKKEKFQSYVMLRRIFLFLFYKISINCDKLTSKENHHAVEFIYHIL